MIVVDTSVWIDLLRNRETRATECLRAEQPNGTILLGDIVLAELLMGVHDDQAARKLTRQLSFFPRVRMLNANLAMRAGRHYRLLRRHGVTIRSTPDLIIGTYCIARDHTLLHSDRDFEPMARHLGLKCL